MALNVKVLLDPKFYYQKLRELATKSKENFSKIGSDIGKIFTSARDQIRGSDISVKDFASQIVLAGGAFELIKKGAETAFRFIDIGMQNAKARFLDFFNSIGDAANTYAAYEKQQQQLSSDNTSALDKLANLQLSGPKLNHTQQEEQRQAIEMLRKSYRGLKVDIDGATGKIKNFEEIQQKILSSDQKKELTLIQQQIKMLEKQNNVGQHNIQYTGGFFSEYWEKLKETYGWGEAQEIGGARKANVDKLMELRWREFNLKYKDRAADASRMFAARRKDAIISDKKADFLAKEAQDNEYQRLITGTITAPDVPAPQDQTYHITPVAELTNIPSAPDQTYRVTGSVSSPDIPEVTDQTYRVTGSVSSPDIPQVTDQTYRVTGSVSSPDIPEVADQTYRVTGSVSSPDIPEVADQTYRVTGSIDAPEVQMVTNPELERAQIYQLINNLKKQGVELSREEAAEIIKGRQALASAAHYKEQIRSLSEQVQIQSLLAQGMDEAAQRQQILNELKRKGLSYDSASVDKILELNQKLGAIKLQNAQKKEAESLYGRALRVMGMNRQADEKSALQKAREQKGSELTDAEKASTLKLLHLTSQLEGLGSTNRMDFAVQTNALTARGGFQTGVRSRDDALTQYNNQMMNLSKNHLRVAEEIRQHLDNMMGD